MTRSGNPNPHPPNQRSKGTKKCFQCGAMKPGPEHELPCEFPEPMPKRHPVCNACLSPEGDGAPKVPLDPDSDLSQALDQLIAYTKRVSEDAPLRLASAFAGMRAAAATIDSEDRNGAGVAWTAYTSLHRQVLDTLRSVYGSASLDLVEQIWKRVDETAAKRAALGWETEPPKGSARRKPSQHGGAGS